LLRGAAASDAATARATAQHSTQQHTMRHQSWCCDGTTSAAIAAWQRMLTLMQAVLSRCRCLHPDCTVLSLLVAYGGPNVALNNRRVSTPPADTHTHARQRSDRRTT
jgi:hypothetical protein